MTLGQLLQFLIDHIGDIQGAIDLVKQIIADFGETEPVTIEMIEAAQAKLNPVPEKSDGTV